MTDGTNTDKAPCARAESAAAYLDGELDVAASALYEGHVGECAACSDALNEQRRLLCLLDNAFSQRAVERRDELPKEFTRVVTARARTDMGGLRSRSERAFSAKLTLVLAALTAVMLGASSSDAAFAPAGAALRAVAGVARLTAHAALDAGAGLAVILRALGGRLVAGPQPLAVLYCLLSGCAFLFLLRLIKSYHRAR